MTGKQDATVKKVPKKKTSLDHASTLGRLDFKRPKRPADGPDPSEKATVEIPKRAKTEKLKPTNIEAIQRLRLMGSSIGDIEDFTGWPSHDLL